MSESPSYKELESFLAGLPEELSAEERDQTALAILADVAELQPLEQERILQGLKARLGLPLKLLREQLKAVKAETIQAPEGSCRAAVERALADGNHARAAEAAFTWFKEAGARFFRTRQGELSFFFENAFYRMDSRDDGQRRLFRALIYQHTGVDAESRGGRTFFEVLANMAALKGEFMERLSWLHIDITKYTVYFNLNNDDHEIAKITPEGVTILKNGGNDSGIILESSEKISPITYISDPDVKQAEALIKEFILDNLTCGPSDRYIVILWISCFLLLDFAGTKPITRFEGSSGSAKTTAVKLLSALLFGETQHKISTSAANYSDGAKNPLVVLDNIETKNMTDELLTFMLVCATGIVKEKRKGGTDTETVKEKTKCLLSTTGIEPLGGQYSEVLSRSLVIRFSLDEGASEAFLETKVLAAIREHRNLILSALMLKTSQVLAMLRDGAQERVMGLLYRVLGSHDKRRCNDYLSLMYLMALAGEPADKTEAAMETLAPWFINAIDSLNSTSTETARDSNPIATALVALFRAHQRALEADEKGDVNFPDRHKIAFVERFQVEIETEGAQRAIKGILARELYITLQRVAKEFNLPMEMKSPRQLAQRLANDKDILDEAGFMIATTPSPRKTQTYNVFYLGDLCGKVEGAASSANLTAAGKCL